MSEFKFACPVCGQHITADSHAAGTPLECPTCYRKIVVPQGPSSEDPKFILSAAEANKPRLPQPGTTPALGPMGAVPDRRVLPLWVLMALVAVCAAGAAVFVLRGKLFHRASAVARSGNAPAPNAPAPAAVNPEQESPHGGIGLGAWNTEVEYDDVVVTKGTQTLYQSDFSAGAPDWLISRGNWIATNGVFRQTLVATDCRATTGQGDWSDYTVRLRARKIAGREGFLILFNVADERNLTWWNLGGWDDTTHALEHSVAGAKSGLGPRVHGRIENKRWYDVRIELDGPRIRCYLDNQLIEDTAYPPPPVSSASRSSSPSSSGR